MQTSHYLPGKAIILSRLPAQDWFTLDEAAEHSGWSRSFIRLRVISGELPAQAYPAEPAPSDTYCRARLQRTRIHIDDLVLFILRNGNGRYTDEKTFRDAATIMRTWPAWMRREMVKHLQRSLTPSVPPETGSHAQGTVVMAPKSGITAVRSPGGERAATLS
jgi:hypothetical protein